ncbi:MAG TPA: hypothetical protein VJS45_07210 [Acidimicrobiia bacterium]|jgi:hypothetical protein|nr:hypothetical protein [Acidimicrobiia bacterium]
MPRLPGAEFYLFVSIFTAALGLLILVDKRRDRLFRHEKRPMASHRCMARALFSELGKSSFQLDALVEACDDPFVPAGLAFTLQLQRRNRRSDYLFSKVRASVERGDSLFVDVEDYLTSRKARLCANGWTVVLDVVQVAGWPSAGFTWAHQS